MKTNRQTWKNLEKEIAKRLKGKRTSREKMGEISEDVLTRVTTKANIVLNIECKLRGSYPKIIYDAISQAEKASNGGLPVCCFKGKGKNYNDVIVGMRLSDFEKLLK